MKAMRMIFTVAVVALSIAGCNSGSGDSEKIYDIKGTVVSVDMEKEKPLSIVHEDIPGLMPGMKMSFKVENVKMLEGLKAGDSVQGKLKVKSGEYLISELQKR